MLTFAISFATIIMAFILVGIHVPADRKLDSFRRSKQYLALSYFLLGMINLFSFFSHKEAQDQTLLSATTIVMASYQALLFTTTILVLIQPLYVRKKFVLTHVGLITFFGMILFVTLFMAKNILFPFVFYATVAIYLMQLAFYTQLFRGKYKKCLKKLEDYYDEDEHYRLRWVSFSFYSALGIGILALVSLFANLFFYSLFSIVYTAYYAYMLHRFYNYQIDSGYIISAVTQNTDNEAANVEQDGVYSEVQCAQFEKALAKWVEEKKFTEKDASVEEIAKQLGIDYYFLRYYFSTYIGIDFRSWRLELRIREAKYMMAMHPELSTHRVCEKVGFGDRSNFHKQFLKNTGMTPAQFKHSLSSSR